MLFEISNFQRRLSLLNQLIKRDVQTRYKSSYLGALWSIITPIMMLLIYTFVFGVIFRAKWTGAIDDATTTQFALIVFAGLTFHQLLAEVLLNSTNLILSNQNYVKKVVFPLQILVPASLGAGLFHALISIIMLLIATPFVFGTLPWTVIFLPLILMPYCLIILGFGWFFSSLGVFIRDINQALGPIITAALFLAPIFFPTSNLPIALQPWIKVNPITIPIEQTHRVVFYGELPEFHYLSIYYVCSFLIAIAGYYWFMKTKKGFADVL